MPSIVDMIAQTEQEAEKLRSDALTEAKALIDEARAEADADIASAQADVRREILLRRENAANTGERLAQEIIAMRKKESAHNCEESGKHIDRAVKYIIERLTV